MSFSRSHWRFELKNGDGESTVEASNVTGISLYCRMKQAVNQFFQCTKEQSTGSCIVRRSKR